MNGFFTSLADKVEHDEYSLRLTCSTRSVTTKYGQTDQTLGRNSRSESDRGLGNDDIVMTTTIAW
jgi:hypothetical protein